MHWSKRRGTLSVFASLAAVGFLAAWASPTAMAFARSGEPVSDTVSLYASSIHDAQSLVVDADSGAQEFSPDRGGYQVYVKPKPTPTPEAASVGVAARPYFTGGGSPAEWMAAAGIAESDWGFVDYIVSHESGWNPNATNRSSGACGLVQALPCSKVPGNGYDPVDNLRWGNGYAVGRYGSWERAYEFWTSRHWW